MCSRYFTKEEENGARIDVHPMDLADVWIPGPGGHAVCARMRWGFPGGEGQNLVFNARAESAAWKSMFSESLAYRRCAVPALGFYEWNAAKEKVSFQRPDKKRLYFAAFYQQIEVENRFVILTTKANVSMERIHDRMPLILERKEAGAWLSAGKAYESLLQKLPPELSCQMEYEQQCFEFL